MSEEVINSKVIEPCQGWQEQFAASLRESKCSNEIIAFRCNMVTCLYYKVLEHIIREEHRKKPHLSLQVFSSRIKYYLPQFPQISTDSIH